MNTVKITHNATYETHTCRDTQTTYTHTHTFHDWIDRCSNRETRTHAGHKSQSKTSSKTNTHKKTKSRYGISDRPHVAAAATHVQHQRNTTHTSLHTDYMCIHTASLSLSLSLIYMWLTRSTVDSCVRTHKHTLTHIPSSSLHSITCQWADGSAMASLHVLYVGLQPVSWLWYDPAAESIWRIYTYMLWKFIWRLDSSEGHLGFCLISAMLARVGKINVKYFIE